MDHSTEFEGNAQFGRFALYLRPLNPHGWPLYVECASRSQKRWGGLHCTLCGFAPEAGSGAQTAHPSSPQDALDMAYAAAVSAAHSDFVASSAMASDSPASQWQLRSNAPLPADGRALLLSPTARGDSDRTLDAIAAAVEELGLLNARPAASLHISIGSDDAGVAEVVREALRTATRWELVIARCRAGVVPLQLTDVRPSERRELEWGARIRVAVESPAGPSESPAGPSGS